MSGDSIAVSSHPSALRLHDTSKDQKSDPCPDCGRTYTVGESVQVRVQNRPEPVWEGCIDCWMRRTSPEVCETFVAKS